MKASCWVGLLLAAPGTVAADSPRNPAKLISPGGLPARVHVFEDYETDIEKRWWLRGAIEPGNVPPSRSKSVGNRRACRATATKDFDDLMGDPAKEFKAVVFNPVPGPPMGANTRLSFRYWLSGTDSLRVQIYSLSNGFHRFLTLAKLPQRSWQSATVDMTAARRPDGSGGSLSEDERIDDIQFYIAPEAELLIDDIVLYDAAPPPLPPSPSGGKGVRREAFPARFLFTGWFDTGRQGAEWPGDFDIVPHEPPLTWKAAKGVAVAPADTLSIRLNLRGERPLSAVNRLRFRHRSGGSGTIQVALANSRSGKRWDASVSRGRRERWAEATVDFTVHEPDASADELRFAVANAAELLVDDVLLFEPGADPGDRIEAAKPSE